MIKTAVIPVAGFGTRMLPASKSISKEMLPLADKPVIDYIVEECLLAGIEHIVLITHSRKSDIENYFDKNFELEASLQKSNKNELLKIVQKYQSDDLRITAVRQGEAKGLGHAILCARDIVGNQPFAVLLPDVIVESLSSESNNIPLFEMIQQFKRTRSSQIMVEPVAAEDVSKYGIVDLSKELLEISNSKPLQGIVEKPSVEDAPSNLAVVGRYVFSPKIWQHLELTRAGVGGEIQLTDAILSLLVEENVYAVPLKGVSKDCGCKIGYYKAFVDEVLSRNDQESKKFLDYLVSIADKHLQTERQPTTEQVSLKTPIKLVS